METETELAKRYVAEADALIRKDGLELIRRMNRHQLLIAMDYSDGHVKMNTDRLRRKLRQLFLDGSPYHDLYILQNAWYSLNVGQAER